MALHAQSGATATPSAPVVSVPVSPLVVPSSPPSGTSSALGTPAPGLTIPLTKPEPPKDNFEVLKEAIAASNRTVDQVSKVFQGFGWWIGVLATLITAAGGFLTWFTFKSLSEARAEHRKHLAEHAEEWSNALTTVTAKATAEMEKISAAAKKHAEAAETSALAAEKFATEIETSKGVLDQMMKDVDQLRGRLKANVAEMPSTGSPGSIAVPARAVDEFESDAAQVAAELQNRVGSPPEASSAP